MRVTTKVWLIISTITLAIVLVSTVFSIQLQVDRRVNEPRQFNRAAYKGLRRFFRVLGTPWREGTEDCVQCLV